MRFFLLLSVLTLVSIQTFSQEKKFIKKVVAAYDEKKYQEALTELNEFVQKNGMTTYAKYFKALIYYEIGNWQLLDTCSNILSDFTGKDNQKMITEKEFTFDPETGSKLFPGFYVQNNGKFELNLSKGKEFMNKYANTCWCILREREYPELLKKSLNEDDLEVIKGMDIYDVFDAADYIKNKTYYKGNFKMPAKDKKAVKERIPSVESKYIIKGVGVYTQLNYIMDNFKITKNPAVGQILLNKLNEKLRNSFKSYRTNIDSLTKFVSKTNIDWYYNWDDFIVKAINSDSSIYEDITRYKDKAATILWEKQKDKWTPDYEKAKAENNYFSYLSFTEKWGEYPFDNVEEIRNSLKIQETLIEQKKEEKKKKEEEEANQKALADSEKQQKIKEDFSSLLTDENIDIPVNIIFSNCINIYKDAVEKIRDADYNLVDMYYCGNLINLFNKRYVPLMSENVIKYNNLEKTYDTELKLKVFKESEDYKALLTTLKNDKKKYTEEFCFILPYITLNYSYDHSDLEKYFKYDINKKGFYLTPLSTGCFFPKELIDKSWNSSKDFYQKSFLNFLFEGFNSTRKPTVIGKQQFDANGNPLPIHKSFFPYEFFIPINEQSALKVEENIKDIDVIFIFKFKGLTKETNNKKQTIDAITTNGLRIIFYNKRTNEICASKLISKESGAKTQQKKVETKSGSQVAEGILTGGGMNEASWYYFEIKNSKNQVESFMPIADYGKIKINGLKLFNDDASINTALINKKVKVTYIKKSSDGMEIYEIVKIETI